MENTEKDLNEYKRNTDRKLASVRTVTDIKAIPDKDRIVQYDLDGWKVIDQKDKYKVGDLVVYLEPDSFVPNSLVPFLTKEGKTPKTFAGISGEILKTVKFGGAISQGIILDSSKVNPDDLVEGKDLTDTYQIYKYEAPVKSFRGSSMPKGNFPYFIHKTAQERVQNIKSYLLASRGANEVFEVTRKLHGMSMTVYNSGNTVGVCSHNVDLLESPDNLFWKQAHALDLVKALKDHWILTNKDLAIQGELIGVGCCNNQYKLAGNAFYVFDIFDIKQQKYLLPHERYVTIEALKESGARELESVPAYSRISLLEGFNPDNIINELLEFADIEYSRTGHEGLVYKSLERDFSFKVVSNLWLANTKG